MSKSPAKQQHQAIFDVGGRAHTTPTQIWAGLQQHASFNDTEDLNVGSVEHEWEFGSATS